MSDSYIRSLPGMVKGADNQKTDILKLLQLEGVVPRVEPALARGYASPPLATVRIGDDYYDAAAVLGAIGGALGAVTRIATASGNPAELDSTHAQIARALVTTIAAVQPGEGTPSPDNVRPISGWDALSICHGAAYDAAASPALTAALPGVVYGGTLDWTTGLLTVTHEAITYDGTEEWTFASTNAVCSLKGMPDRLLISNQEVHHICSHYRPIKYKTGATQTDKTCYTLNTTTLMVKDTSLTSLEDWTAYLAAQAAAGTPMTIVWRLKPSYYKTIRLTPQQLTLLKGSNSVWSDAGDTVVTYTVNGLAALEQRVAALETAVLAMGANI